MSQFRPNTYPLGSMKVATSADAVFVRPAGGKKISQVSPACGCTTYTLTETELRVTMNAGYLPEGIVAQKMTEYDTSKGIDITYVDGTFETLWVTAHISQ